MSRMDKMFKIDRIRGLLACEAFLILLILLIVKILLGFAG